MDHNLFFFRFTGAVAVLRDAKEGCDDGVGPSDVVLRMGDVSGERQLEPLVIISIATWKHEEAHAASMSVRYIRTRVFPAVFAFFSLHPNENATVLEMARTIHAASAPASTEWDAATHLSLGDHEVRLQDALKLAGMAICRNLQIRACSQHIVQGNGRRCKAPRDWSMDFSAPA